MKISTNILFKHVTILVNRTYIHNIILNCVRKGCFLVDLYLTLLFTWKFKFMIVTGYKIL